MPKRGFPQKIGIPVADTSLGRLIDIPRVMYVNIGRIQYAYNLAMLGCVSVSLNDIFENLSDPKISLPEIYLGQRVFL